MNKFNVIFATSRNHVLGKNNTIPWLGNYPLDLKYFKKITSQSPLPNLKNIVIMGRNTWESLPNKNLSNRIPIIISNTLNYKNINVVKSFDDALKLSNKIEHNKIWVIGGKQVFQEAFNDYRCNNVYHSIINEEYEGDINLKLPNPKIIKNNFIDNINFNIYKLNGEFQYLRLLSKILNKGEFRSTRNANTWSLFNEHLEFDLEQGFPLLTTKKMFWKGIVEELLFFIRGNTNSKILELKGINIWKGNTSRDFIDNLGLPYPEGDMGEMYGWQWRHFGADYVDCYTDYKNQGFDQLVKVIEEIKTNPFSRRILMSDFNPSTADKGVLYPCHSLIIQFYNRENNILDIKMYQRSVDSFLGLPFNIASTSLLLIIIAQLTNKKPGKVFLTLGDCHIYENHEQQVKTQLKRMPLEFPNVSIPNFKTLDQVENSSFKDFELINYKHENSIKAQMIA